MLFVSKLLPLLIYPLGLSCLLLSIALVLWWKRFYRWLPIPIALALFLLFIGGNGWTSNLIVQSLEWQYLPKEIPSAEAIVVLGGGIKPSISPRPMVDVSEQGDRVLYGAQLYRENKAPLVIVSGGRIEWYGGGQPESIDMAQLLKLMGVPREAIVEDPVSLNTYENAVEVKKILDKKNLKNILLVTSAMHMPRSVAIFQRQGINVIPAPTDFLVSEQELREINTPKAFIINLFPDTDNLDKATRALKEYIGIFIYKLRGWL
jgi:uncharacterized SAM-binding protein YcdF (DUF218 family)